MLFHGDNLTFMRKLPDECVDLITTDPPFNCRKRFTNNDTGASFNDSWEWDVDAFESLTEPQRAILGAIRLVDESSASFMLFMAPRLIEMHRILKPTGSIYVQSDPTASHYLKIIMDLIFGRDNFLNEIIWSYRRWTVGSKQFQRLHDTILFYSKSNGKHTFNPPHYPLEQQKCYDTGYQKYNRKNRGTEMLVYDADKAADAIRDFEGRIVYVDKGPAMGTVWSDIKYMGSLNREKIGYPTQKPKALFRRMIEASSNPGDMVFDPFIGSGTTAMAAEDLNRQWIGSDLWPDGSIDLVKQRMQDAGLECGLDKFFVNAGREVTIII